MVLNRAGTHHTYNPSVLDCLALSFKSAMLASFKPHLRDTAGLQVPSFRCALRRVGDFFGNTSFQHLTRRSPSAGIVIGASVQAALYTAVPAGLADWRGNQYSFYFLIGCLAVAMVLVVIFLPKMQPEPRESRDRNEGTDDPEITRDVL